MEKTNDNLFFLSDRRWYPTKERIMGNFDHPFPNGQKDNRWNVLPSSTLNVYADTQHDIRILIIVKLQ
jgi:hypothetical protein